MSKKKTAILAFILTVSMMVSMTGCEGQKEDEDISSANSSEQSSQEMESSMESQQTESKDGAMDDENLDSITKPYSDVKHNPDNENSPESKWNLTDRTDITEELIPTLIFNHGTKFPDDIKAYGEEIIEKGKNPGLGVRDIHTSDITGKGVNVAIIDQPILNDHPEYDGKIVEYKNFDEDYIDDKGDSQTSMHGPAVTSLLVGETIGTAPGANVYYASTPSWKCDAKYFADALDWIVDINKTLPISEKIRVVSVSAAPSGNRNFENGDLWDVAYKRARDEGLVVLDCTENNGFIHSSYLDINKPDDISLVSPGFPNMYISSADNTLSVPASLRTVAEQPYDKDISSYTHDYTYYGVGGQSWSIPYAAGVLALGFEVKPELTGNDMVEYLFSTAYEKDDYKYINPPVFIEKLQSLD